MDAMKKAIILARVSTAGQAEEELPIASQVEACKTKAEQLGAAVVRVFTEEGVSGRKERRDVFQEAVDYCGVMEIDYFILWNTARFARSKAVAAWTKHLLRRGGTEMVYVSQNIDTSTDEGWLLESIFEMMDEQYSRTVSKDTRRSMMKNARDGFFNGGRVPLGYRIERVGKRSRLAIDEDEAGLVRQIFAECAAGAGAKNIALRLNRAGLYRRGARWTKNTVINLLRNWCYAGYTTFNRTNHATREERPAGEWIRTVSHPSIIPEEEFMAVQKMRAARATSENAGHMLSRFLFTGMLRCGACDAGLLIQTGTGRRGKVYSYYNCGSSLKGKGCSSRMIPAAKLDAWLMQIITRNILSRSRIEEIALQIQDVSGAWVKERAQRRRSVVVEIRDLEVRRRNLFDILEHHGKDAPNLGDLTVRLRELNNQIKALEASLTELEATPAPAEAIGPSELDDVEAFVREMIEHGSPQKVREFLGSFIEKVDLNDNDAVVHYHPTRLVDARPLRVVRSSGNWLPDVVGLRTEQLRAELPEAYWRRAA